MAISPGSGWKEYRATGRVVRHRAAAPACARATGCPSRSSRRRRRPSRASHDENIDFDDDGRASSAASWPSASATSRCACTATRRRSPSGPGSCWPTPSSSSGWSGRPASCCSIDEVLTPDSSRFWDAASYEPGRAQASFDKQFVRDWLETQPWDKTAPGRRCRPTSWPGRAHRYVEAYERITGASFERYLEEDVDRPMSELPVRRQRHAQARHPRSAGPGRGGQPGAPRDRRRQRGARRPAGRADGRRRRRGRGPGGRRAAGGRAAVEPADRGVRGRGAGRGVVGQSSRSAGD